MNKNSGNTIFFNPSNDQILAIAQEHPDLHLKLKEQVMAELQKAGLKHIQNRLQQKANTAFENLYKTVEGKFLKSSGWGNSSTFTESLEKKLSLQIETKMNEALEEEMKEYLASEEFKTVLKNRVQQQLVTAVVKALDTQIAAEAKKLIA